MAGLFRRIVGKMFPSRQAPARPTTQAAQVLERKFGGSTKDMARAYGVTPRAVQRWLKGDRTPEKITAKDREKFQKAVDKARRAGKPEPVMKPKPGDRLEGDAAAVQVTDRGRERRAKQMEKEPAGTVRIRVERAGTFSVRKSDAVRPQTIELDLTPGQAAALARAKDEDDVRAVVGNAVADYFNGGSPYGGFRGEDFDFDPNGVDLS